MTERHITFPTRCVTLKSGRVVRSPVLGDAGLWHHCIVYIDAAGAETTLLTSECQGFARHQAFQIAQKRGCVFIDRSEKEPQ